jgi:hypothetical protein
VQNLLWARGVHLTAEEWAYHTLLVRLGYPNHHREMPGMAIDATAPAMNATRITMSLARTPSIGASPNTPFAPDGTPFLAMCAMLAFLLPGAFRRRNMFDTLIFDSLRLPPPEKPPPPTP